jgi:hypothetical protein
MADKTVICPSDPESPHSVNRVLCVLGARSACSTCPNRIFKLRFQFRIVDQTTACPRWASEEVRKERKDPLGYVMLSRGECLQRPYLQCEDCPNSDPVQYPRSQIRWWEAEEKARKLQLALDEEDKG